MPTVFQMCSLDNLVFTLIWCRRREIMRGERASSALAVCVNTRCALSKSVVDGSMCKGCIFSAKEGGIKFWPSHPVSNECVGSLIWEKGISNFGLTQMVLIDFLLNNFSTSKVHFCHICCACVGWHLTRFMGFEDWKRDSLVQIVIYHQVIGRYNH